MTSARWIGGKAVSRESLKDYTITHKRVLAVVAQARRRQEERGL